MTEVVQIVGDGGRGGGTTYIIGLARRLIECGHRVTVITDSGSFLERHAREVGAQAIGLPFTARINTPLLAIMLRRHLHRLRPEIVHAHGSRAALPLALTALQRRWRFVYTIHGLHFAAKRQPVRRLGWYAERFCIGHVDEVVFVCDADRKTADRYRLLRNARNWTVIPNGADVDIEPEPLERRVYDIGFLGRLVEAKNPLLLCDILAAMRPLQPRLIVVGAGPLEKDLQARAEQLGVARQIVMVGELPRREALQALARCRTFVLPSRNEGQPLAVIEAAHLGIPTVASAVSGLVGLISHGETGFLVDSTDVTAFASCLTCLLTDPALADRMSRAAQERARRDFTFERVVEANLNVYKLPALGGSDRVMVVGNHTNAVA